MKEFPLFSAIHEIRFKYQKLWLNEEHDLVDTFSEIIIKILECSQ
jgi:hypothetical protein